ncbi:diguanylate cyclase [gamma proteobacterium HTCC5015]|nr:diguanylate cyclase [gamma proteobacterium HTCC5015]
MKPRIFMRYMLGTQSEILDWSTTQKAQFVYAWIAEIALWIALLLLGASHFEWMLGNGLNNEVANTAIIVILVLAACCGIGFILGFKADATAWTSKLYAHICIQFFVAVNMVLAYYAGVFSVVSGVALVGGSLTGFILFNERVVYGGLFTGALATLALIILSALEVIPYASVIETNGTPLHHNATWLILLLGLSTPYIGLLVAMNSSAIRRWRQRESEVRQLSTTDPLTQVANRRHLLERLNLEISRCERSGHSELSLLMMDLDHFKSINDEHGHLFGDEALRVTARVLREQSRNTDLVGRYGGEEFCLLLPDTGPQGALQIAERCRQALEQADIDREDGEVLHITTSIGLATYQMGDTNESLLHRADEALYQAKEQGRNRIVQT